MMENISQQIEQITPTGDLVSIGELLSNVEKIIDLTTMKKAEILYFVYKTWGSFKDEYKWEYDFYKWAKQYAKTRNQEPAKQTIDNLIAVYREFIAEETIEYPQFVYIEKDKPTEFDPKQIDYSKLLKVKGKAKRGEMTPEDWADVANPKVTVRQLNTKQETNNDDFRLFEQDGIIYAFQDGQSVPIGHLELEFENNPIWRRGVDFLLSSCGLHVATGYKC